MVEKRVEQQLRTSQMEDDVVNVEFLEWLKVWGPRIFIGCCLVVIVFRLTMMWLQYNEDRKSEAWRDLQEVQTVAGMLQVADDHRAIGSIAELAWLRAASEHFQTLLDDETTEDDADALDDALAGNGDEPTGENETAVEDGSEQGEEGSTDATDEAAGDSTDAEGNDTDESAETDETPKQVGLTDEERADLLSKMENLYQRVIDASKDDPDKRMFEIRAAFGMATVAEMRLDYETARSWYERAEELCGERYTKLKFVAQKRRSNMEEWVQPVEFPTNDEIRALEEANQVPELLKRPQGETDEPSGENPEGTAEIEGNEKPADSTGGEDSSSDGEGGEDSNKNSNDSGGG